MIDEYVLTAAAEADLRAIIRYTRGQWGDVQARRYVGKLTDCIKRIASTQGGFKDMSGIYPGLRMSRCEHHYIFRLPREDARTLIVALFHERMDLMARLADRLDISH